MTFAAEEEERVWEEEEEKEREDQSGSGWLDASRRSKKKEYVLSGWEKNRQETVEEEWESIGQRLDAEVF